MSIYALSHGVVSERLSNARSNYRFKFELVDLRDVKIQLRSINFWMGKIQKSFRDPDKDAVNYLSARANLNNIERSERR